METQSLPSFGKIKVAGKYIHPSDTDFITNQLLKLKIYQQVPQKSFSNVVQWNWKNKSIRAHIYAEYAIIEKLVEAPEGWLRKDVWILKDIVPLGFYKNQEVDEIKMIKSSVSKAFKGDKADWNKKHSVSSLAKKLKKSLKENLPEIWFANDKSQIKNISNKRKIIYIPVHGGGVGHTEQQRLYQIMFDISVDKHNILNIFQGNVEGSFHGGDWSLGPSDLVAKFGPWQSEEEIVNAVSKYAERY